MMMMRTKYIGPWYGRKQEGRGSDEDVVERGPSAACRSYLLCCCENNMRHHTLINNSCLERESGIMIRYSRAANQLMSSYGMHFRNQTPITAHNTSSMLFVVSPIHVRLRRCNCTCMSCYSTLLSFLPGAWRGTSLQTEGRTRMGLVEDG